MAGGPRRGGVALVLAALAMGGCGGSEAPASPSPDVTGTIIDTWWQDDGSKVARPRVPAGLVISAYLPQAGGGYRIIPGTIGADGHFSIPGVGFATYFLGREEPGTGLRLLETEDHLLTLGGHRTGRPDATVAATSTVLSFQLTGLKPWTAADKLELSSSGAGFNGLSYGGGFEPGNTGGPAAFNFMSWPLAAAGDLGWIVQYSVVTPTPGGPSHEAASRYTLLRAAQTLADGDWVSLGPVALSTPSTAGSVGLDVRGSEFAALAPALGASTVTPYSARVAVYASPRGPGGGPHTRLLRATLGTPTGDVDFGTLAVPRFLPDTFVEWREMSYVFNVQFSGLKQPSYSYGNRVVEPVTGAAGVIRPTLGPAKALRIGGLDLAQPQAGVGLTPVLTWAPPDLGTPGTYLVSLKDATDTTWTSVLSATIKQTRFEIPANVLRTGRTYVVTIWSTATTDFDLAAPIGSTGRSASTATVGEPFTP